MKTFAIPLVAFLLAGCAAPVAQVPLTPNAPAPAATTATATPTPASTNARGNLLKAIGQDAGVVSEAGQRTISFKVTGIEPNFKCTSRYKQAAANGGFVAVSLDITTAPGWDPSASPMSFDASAWSVISPQGKTENDSFGKGYMCLNDPEQIPSKLGPGEHVEGKIVLDTAYSAAGAIVLKAPGSFGGWEWSYA